MDLERRICLTRFRCTPIFRLDQDAVNGVIMIAMGIDWKNLEFEHRVRIVALALRRLGILVAVSLYEYSVPQPIPACPGCRCGSTSSTASTLLASKCRRRLHSALGDRVVCSAGQDMAVLDPRLVLHHRPCMRHRRLNDPPCPALHACASTGRTFVSSRQCDYGQHSGKDLI